MNTETPRSKKVNSLQPIPDEIKKGCPENCPVCGKPVFMVWRCWGKGTVVVEFSHEDQHIKEHKRTYTHG